MDMGFWLGRKYALLQQQANAADTQNKNQKIGITAAANVDNTRAALMPKESMASIAKTNAETGMIGEQTRWFGPEASARIENLGANSFATRIGGLVAKKEGLDEVATTPQSLAAIRAMRGGLPTMGSVFSPVADTRSRMPLSGAPATQRRLPGESERAWLDRINDL